METVNKPGEKNMLKDISLINRLLGKLMISKKKLKMKIKAKLIPEKLFNIHHSKLLIILIIWVKDLVWLSHHLQLNGLL